MAAVEAYLVRDGAGRMMTIMAQSVNGAKQAYLRTKRPKKGTQFSVKPRGYGDWTHFDVI